MLSKSERSHNTGTPPNPALLIGLRLTPVSSICFCLKRALKTRSLQEGNGKTNHFTREIGRNFTSSPQSARGSHGEVMRKDYLLITILSNSASSQVFALRVLATDASVLGGIQQPYRSTQRPAWLCSLPFTLFTQRLCCHTQAVVRSLTLGLSSAHARALCPNDCLSVRSFLVLLN